MSKKALLFLSAAGTALAFAQPSWSQMATTAPNPSVVSVGEVVVTAQRREERLQDVPIAVSAINSEAMVKAGVYSAGDLRPGLVPSLVTTRYATSNALQITIRGIGTTDPRQATKEAPTAVYIDGVYMARVQGLGIDLAAPERIEVLRGPQGQLFGRNAEGGAIQIITRKPTGKYGVDATAELGNYDQRRFVAHLNLPEVAGFSVLFDLLSNNHAGYTHAQPRQGNLLYQQDFDRTEDVGYRWAVRWAPVQGVTIDYAYDYIRSHYTSPLYVLENATAPASPSTPVSDTYPRDTPRPLYNAPAYGRVKGHTLTAAWDVSPNITLKAIGAYRWNYDDGGNQLGQTANASGVISQALLDESQKSLELQAIGSYERLKFTTGLFFFREDALDDRESLISIVNDVAVNPIVVPNSRTRQTAISKSYAAYGQATYVPPLLGDRLELTAGLRYTHDRKDMQRQIGSPVGAPYPRNAQFRASRVDPAFTVKMNWTPTVNTYLRYATAYRGGGISVRSVFINPFGQEEIKSLEAGLKSDLFDRRVRFNAALYANRVTGYQIDVQESPLLSPSITTTINAPVTFKTQGFEGEVTIVPTRNLTIGLNYSYGHYSLPAFDNPLTPAVDITKFIAVGFPKNSGGLTVDYVEPLPMDLALAFHIDHQRAGKYSETALIPPGLLFAETNLWNGRIALQNIRVGGGELEIAAWVRNAFNNNDIAFQFQGANGGTAAVLTAPRTYGVDLRAHW